MKSPSRLIRTALAAAILATGAALVPAQAQVNLNINIGPPAPRYELVPTVPQGYVWAPGYWAGQGQDYRWVRGRQIAQRPGQRWVADHWEEGNRYRAGYWEQESRDDHHGKEHGKKHGKEHGKEHGHGHKDEGDFCPPGQAKKGNC